MGKVLSKYYQRDKRVKNGIQVYGYWVVKNKLLEIKLPTYLFTSNILITSKLIYLGNFTR
jgi:hypothetical protein